MPLVVFLRSLKPLSTTSQAKMAVVLPPLSCHLLTTPFSFGPPQDTLAAHDTAGKSVQFTASRLKQIDVNFSFC